MLKFTKFIADVCAIKLCQLLLCNSMQYCFPFLQICYPLFNKLGIHCFNIGKNSQLTNCSRISDIKACFF